VLRTAASLASESSFTSSAIYIAQPLITFSCSSAMYAFARKKWENEDDTPETWNAISDTSETWTQISDTSESWNSISDSSSSWTQISDTSETWTRIH
jgi:hypothetical protein